MADQVNAHVEAGGVEQPKGMEMLDPKILADIAERWEGVSNGHRELTFEKAKADMATLLAAARSIQEMKGEVAALKAHVRKRNADMQAFAAEVGRLANQKYSDYMDLGKDSGGK